MINHRQRLRATLIVAVFVGVAGLVTTDALAQAPFSYYRVQTLIDAASFGDVTWVDLDGDGDQDLVLVSSTGPGSRTPTSTVFEQVGTVVTTTEEGSARPVADYRRLSSLDTAPDLWLADLDWADYDRDGDLDAIVSGTGETGGAFTPAVHLLENDGSGGFSARSVATIAPVMGVARWGDYDNDGDSDLFVMGRNVAGEPSTMLYRNDDGAFSPVESDLPNLAFGDAAWADVDRDGDLDIALCGATKDGSFSTRVFLNDEPGMFRELTFGGAGLVFCSLDWGDYDEDGFPDLLASGGAASHLILEGTTHVYRNAAGTGLEEAPFDVEGIVGGSALWMDVDNDGALDILANGGSDLVFGRAAARIYRNEGSGFRHVSNISGTFPGRLDAGDFDGDGDLDLVMIGPDRDGVAITNVFMNGELVVNASPDPPSGLSSNVSGGRVALRWSAALDDRTTSDALTYNVRAGTAPGLGDVISVPLGSTGRPTRASRGNAGSSAAWSIRDLPNGTYFWSVQAVDNSYNTSTFAQEESFVITASSGTKPVSDEPLPGTPDALRLSDPYPNPMNEHTRIHYELPRSGAVRIEVYDLIGRRLVTLVDRTHTSGSHLTNWDGRDASGQHLAGGVYVIRLSAAADNRSALIVLRR